ncbi:DNA repair protein RAD50 [Cucumispora dikerogammari]|nr:DNA repair protein RAD50 [Cucumispora dikerogammari]
MSAIQKLEISGIRSYKPGTKQILNFYSPLTLIIGPNGSGKTTIVEALKYAITNEQPPNTKNGAFLYDINLLNRNKKGIANKVESYVKIDFLSVMDGQPYQLIRRLVQTKTGEKTTVRTCEASLTAVESAVRSAVKCKKLRLHYNDEIKENVQNKLLITGSKIADTDKTILYHLNLSKALVDNVLLVHQNDSTWPLSDPVTVKKKMDAILDSEKYIKTINDLKEERRRLNHLSKLLEQKYEFSKDLNRKGETIYNEIEADKVTLKKHILTHNEHLTELKNAETKNNQLAEKIREISTNLEVINKLSEKLNCLKNDLVALHNKKTNIIPETLRSEDLKLSEEEIRQKIIIEEEKEEQNKKLRELYNTNSNSINILKHQIRTSNDEIQAKVGEIIKKNDIFNKLLLLDYTINSNNINNTNNIKLNEFSSNDPDRKQHLDTYLNNLKTSISSFLEAFHISLNKLEKYLKESEKQNDLIKTRDTLTCINNKPDTNRYTTDIELKNKQIIQQKKIIKEALSVYSTKEFQFKKHFEETYLNTVNRNKIISFEHQILSEIKELNEKRNRQSNIIQITSSLNEIASSPLSSAELYDIINSEEKLGLFLEKYEKLIKNQQLIKKIEKNEISCKIYEKLKLSGEQKAQCPICKGALNEEFSSRLNKLISLLRLNSEKLSGGTTTSSINSTIDINNIKAHIETIKALIPHLSAITLVSLTDRTDYQKEHTSKQEVLTALNKYKTIQVPEIDLPRLNQKLDLLLKEKEELVEKSNQSMNLNEKEVYLRRRREEVEREILSAECRVERLSGEIENDPIITAIATGKNNIKNRLDTLLAHKETLSKLYHQTKYTIIELIKTLETQDLTLNKLKSLEVKTKTLIISNNTTDQRAHLNNLLNYKIFLSKLENLKTLGCEIQEFLKTHPESEFDELIEYPLSDINSELYTTNFNITNTELHNKELSNTDLIESSIFDSTYYNINHNTSVNNTINEYTINNSNTINEYTDLHISSVDTNNILSDTHNMVIEKLISMLGIKKNNLTHKFNNISNTQLGLSEKILNLNKHKYTLEGEIKQLKKTLATKTTLYKKEYLNTNKDYKKAHLKLRLHSLYLLDLGEFVSCAEAALANYHKEKIAEINESLRILWENTCDSDIDYIEVRLDFEKTYYYKLVMHKKNTISETNNLQKTKISAHSQKFQVCENEFQPDIITNTPMDMRGRCSAGQAMITSILFRLALCENFIHHPTVFALDEPTTNLDDENVEALGATFKVLLDSFKSHQFVIITHDERFMSMINSGEPYYSLERGNGECNIRGALNRD